MAATPYRAYKTIPPFCLKLHAHRLIDPHHRLIGEFRSYVEREFPDYASNRYVAELPRARALAFRLLQKRRYGTVRLLFGLKERLGK